MRPNTSDGLRALSDYIRVGIMMNAVDQRLPPGREALLPALGVAR